MKNYILKTALCFTTAYLSACGATDPIDSNSDLPHFNVKELKVSPTIHLNFAQGKHQVKFENNVMDEEGVKGSVEPGIYRFEIDYLVDGENNSPVPIVKVLIKTALQ